MKDSGGKTANLDSPEAREFQRRSWKVQRVAWCLMGALLIVTALGGLGAGGFLSRTTTRSADQTLSARYDRVWRMENPAVLEITAPPDGNGSLELTIDARFLSVVSVSEMFPLPREIVALPEGQRLQYRAEGKDPVTVRLQVTPHRFGRLRARIAGGKDQSIELPLIVLP